MCARLRSRSMQAHCLAGTTKALQVCAAAFLLRTVVIIYLVPLKL
jgi:hypothetical protein